MRKKTDRNRQNKIHVPDPPPPPDPKGRISKLFDIPQSALSGVPQIEMAGNREAIVDGCQGVLEYDENVIRLSTGSMSVRFTGRGLQLRVLTHDSAVVEGFILNVEFIT